MQGNRRAGVPFLLILVADLLLVAAPAAAVDKHSGRVVINYAAAGSTRGDAHHAVTALMRRRLEDEVAPELISSQWPTGLGAGPGNGGKISYGALKPNMPACDGSCPARGGSYTRPCTFKNQCRH